MECAPNLTGVATQQDQVIARLCIATMN